MLSRRGVPFTKPLRRVLATHGKALSTPARTVEQAGLPDTFRLYDLRHTCATLMLLAGVHPKVVSERLGHASVKITLDTYSHVLPTMQREATERLGTLLYPELPGKSAYN